MTHALDPRATLSVVMVAGGAAKVAALGGALRGGYADVCVTDDVTARGTLRLG